MDTDRDGVADNDDAPFNPLNGDRDVDGYGDNRNGGSGSDASPDDPLSGQTSTETVSGTMPMALERTLSSPTPRSRRSGRRRVETTRRGVRPTCSRLMQPSGRTRWRRLWRQQSGNNPKPSLRRRQRRVQRQLTVAKITPAPVIGTTTVCRTNWTSSRRRLGVADDGDEIGDEADDDDNDGWSDAEEIRQGTDAYSSASIPKSPLKSSFPEQALDSVHDLMIFAGVPLFFWLLFGFVTRTSRAEQLRKTFGTRQPETIGIGRDARICIDDALVRSTSGNQA